MAEYWGVRVGEGGRYVSQARKGNYVAIGWNELGDLGQVVAPDTSYDDAWNNLALRYRKAYGIQSSVSVGIAVGQVMKFMRDIQEGDYVLVPEAVERKVYAAKVISPYQYKESWGDDCPYPHRRSVEWLKSFDRDQLPQKLKFALGALLTIFSLKAYGDQIRPLIEGISGPVRTVTVEGKELSKAVLDRLWEMEPLKFQEFIANLLSAVGFQATSNQLVGDKGVDVTGILNAEGLASIKLQVQVKKVKGSIGIGEVQQLRGALTSEEQGALVTLSTFTKQAAEEAQAPGKKPIVLIEGEGLVDLVLRHYEEIDDKYKDFLGLRKKEIPLNEMFSLTRTE